MSVQPGLRIDLLGVALGASLATWLAVAGLASGGNPGPASALVLTAVAATVLARRWSRRHPIHVPAAVASLPILALLVRRSSLLGDGVLEYSNSSAALYFIAACAAVAAGFTVRRPGWRAAWYLVAVTWALLPWKLGAHAAAILTLVLPLAIVAVRSQRGVRRLILSGSVAAAVGLGATVALGVGEYRPSSGATAFDERFHTALSELRVVLWGESVDITLEHPLMGVGPGRFQEASLTALEQDNASWAHNEYLQLAAESGIPGGLLLVGLLAWCFLCLWRACEGPSCVPAAAALGGIALHANIDFIWHFPEVPIALGMLIGRGAACTPPSDTFEARKAADIEAPVRLALVSTVSLWLGLLAPIDVINPALSIQNGARYLPESNAVRFATPGMIRTTTPPSELYAGVIESGELTVEAWVSSTSADQGGPARIISSSEGISARNFMLGQERAALVFRLRTTRTDPNGVDGQLVVEDVFGEPALRHVVVAADLEETRVYVDGTLRRRSPGAGGSLASWSSGFPLVLGNETSGDRTWLGILLSFAIHRTALSGEVVSRLYAQGPAPAASNPFGSSMLAAYQFEEGSAGSFRGHGPSAVPLRSPERIPSSSRRGIRETLMDSGGSPALRFFLHGALFGLWGMVALGTARRARIDAMTGLVLFGGTALLLASTAVRYLEVRDPSIWDVGGGLLGLVLVLLVTHGEPSADPSART